MDERKYWVWLSMCFGQGSMCAGKLIDYFGSARRAYDSGAEEIAKCISKDKAHTLKIITKYSLEQAEDIVNWCDLHNVRVITFYDEEYPKAIKHQSNLPLVLYAVGKIPRWSTDFSCAVVGTRKMTDYGKRVAYDFGYELAGGGAIVVSGMAIGVDGMAMAGAIDAGGATVAVLGCGIDICYPKAHRQLMREVLKKGAVITEYPPATPPAGSNFPIRNRIISGISQATVVIEGDDNSGALITANHAIYQGRRVFAVPGKVTDESSNGPNALIKRGIPAVSEAFDVLVEYQDLFSDCINTSKLRRKYLSKREDEYLEAAERMHVISSLDKNKENNGYYGNGLYGGRDDGRFDRPDGEKTSHSERKKDVQRKSSDKAPDRSESIKPADTEFLSEEYLRVYNAMKPDVPTLPDEIVSRGFDISEVLVAMTMLELAGIVEASPGGFFTRLGTEELTMPPKEE